MSLIMKKKYYRAWVQYDTLNKAQLTMSKIKSQVIVASIELKISENKFEKKKYYGVLATCFSQKDAEFIATTIM